MSMIANQPIVRSPPMPDAMKSTKLQYPSATIFKMPVPLPFTKQQPTRSARSQYPNLYALQTSIQPLSHQAKFTNITAQRPNSSTNLQYGHYAFSQHSRQFAYLPAYVPDYRPFRALGLRPFTHPDLLRGTQTLRRREDEDSRSIWYGVGAEQKAKFQKIMSLAQGYERNVEGLMDDECRHLAWREVERKGDDTYSSDTRDEADDEDSEDNEDVEVEKRDVRAKMVSFLQKAGEFRMGGSKRAGVETGKEESSKS